MFIIFLSLEERKSWCQFSVLIFDVRRWFWGNFDERFYTSRPRISIGLASISAYAKGDFH